MSRGGARSQWPRVVAAVAVRLHCSPQTVRDMLWVDFREVLRLFGVKVKKTPKELAAEIERFINGQNNRDSHSRS
jgi:predicted nuclease of restriction endonuclease-like RecB superfamily